MAISEAAMREITEHRVNQANDTLKITVRDEPGAGGACHRYLIDGFDTSSNAAEVEGCGGTQMTVLFQNGPIAEVGVNGVTHEALLAIVADRLRSFEAGPYSCEENAAALEHVEAAQRWLHERTKNRMARGVEGTHQI